ncbi:MAG: DUF885 domain-containing protein [Chloroflexi bacterium]|nr:DUF885 domain-containing protein [Chloroflexota bacterium]
MSSDTAQSYADLEREIVEGRMRWGPAGATALGRHDWDAELGELSRGAIDGRLREVAGQIRALETIDASVLPEPYRTRHSIHLRKLRFELSEEEQYGASRHSPGGMLGLIGLSCNSLVIRDFAPLPERVRSLTSRLAQVPRLLAQGRKNFESCTPIHAGTALQQAAGILTMLEHDLPAVVAGVDDAGVRSGFGEAQEKAVQAVRAYTAWLRDEVQPSAAAPIAWGRQRMEKLVRWQECVDLDIDTIVRRGEEDLRRHQERMREVAAHIAPGEAATEVVRRVASDHPSPEQLLPVTQRTLEELRRFCVDRDLIDMPTEVRITLAETPPFSRATTLAACSPPGQLETVATEAYYYVTPPDPSWDAERTDQYLMFFSDWALPLITAHEAYPGHYVHLAWLRRVQDSVPGTTSTTTLEGWGHYTEQLMIEAGWGDGDPRFELAQIGAALQRLCRYVAAFGMHTQGWSYEDAVEFFIREGYATRPVAELESKRGVVGPSYFAYTLGKHEILELRKQLKAKWGAAFSLKRFHNSFVLEPYPTAVIAAKLLA